MSEKVTLIAPPLDSFEEIARFCRTLSETEWQKRVIFDFTKNRRFLPFGMVMVGSAIREFKKDWEGITECRIVGADNPYARHMRFFELCGFPLPRRYGLAKGSSTYIPITQVRAAEIKRRALEASSAIGEVVEEEAAKMARVVAQEAGDDIIEVLTFCMREIFRNAIEHGDASWVRFAGQYWPTMGRAEICVVDNGIGIRKSLNCNPQISASTDSEAIRMAKMPGISGKAWQQSRRRKNDEWRNSGFGLYMTNRICRDFGRLGIITGNIAQESLSNSFCEIESQWAGTAVRISLETNKIARSRPDFEKYAAEGEIESKSIAGASKGPASGASKRTRLLNKD